MSSTPRKSSIASRQAPRSLRAPSASRKVSNPHLSLVFAQGGSVPHHADGESSKSEAALSRQLDGDLGGQRMGLRSRRSSSATVHTMRTTSAVSLAEDGLRSPVLREEEEEDGTLPLAGPSRTPMRAIPAAVEDREGQLELTPSGRGGAFVDPRTSSAWRRWNPPPPTFPKSSIGKGKGKEVVANGTDSMRSFATERPLAMSSPDDPKPPAVVASPSDMVRENGAPPASLAPPLTEEPPGLSTPKRSWWSRSPIPFSPKPGTSSTAAPAPASLPPPTPTAKPPQETSAVPVSSPIPLTTQPDPPIRVPPGATEQPAAPEDPTVPPAVLPPVVANNNGWFSYLTWGRSMPPTAGTTAPVPATSDVQPEAVAPPPEPIPSEPPIVSHEVVAVPPPETQIPPETPPPAAPEPVLDATPVAPALPAAGWGTYLYSFVSGPTTPKRPSTPRQEAPPPTVPPVPLLPSTLKPQPTEAASTPGVASPAPQPEPVVEPPPSVPSLPPTPLLGESPSIPPVPVGSLRKASVTSTTGWLNYLAFRAGQKKITGSTIASNGSASGRPSGEQGREEVMDFSQDPEFPSTPSHPPPGSMGPPPVPVGKDGKPGKSITNKSSVMEIRGKRQSISSTRSAKTPLSSSPVQPTKAELPKPPTVTSRPPSTKSAKGGSSLPPPPQPSATQPNLVIPKFSTTFDRPPRSLPPLPPPDASAGIASTTGGLAWKALAAAGTYVYRSDPKSATQPPATTSSETRGLKEGRAVGADLPRRVGLEGGAADEGWKGITRVVVVGVHGWFPAKMLNSVIGEPTGTSTKFAAMMGAAVTKFFEEHGGAPQDFRLTLMPLEGEGTIDNRVDKLYKSYLSNPAWINELRRADAIFFAAHSQGCIVTAHLLWRMITQGHIRTPLNREAVARCEWAFGPIGLLPPEEPRRGRRPAKPQDDFGKDQRVAMLAMCGVHLGPLYSISTSTVIQPYLQWFENAAARELFEFQESTSGVAVAYQKALSMILENDVRVVLLASLNDQVVPIYGASYSTATHPLLLRALFVDGASYSASDFMTNLLCFAFMLRNAGIDDQRLVEHLSEATAGSLTGLGHSSPYEDAASYDLVVNYLFRAGPARKPHAPLSVEAFSARDTRNDFELPWIMRALVDSPEVKDLFPEELKELKEGILNWKPNTKALKEIKRRLEPMAGRQSKLRPMVSSPSSTSLNSLGKAAGKEVKNGGALGKDW